MKQEKILNLIKSGVDKTAPDCWGKINELTQDNEGEVISMSEIITESKNLKKGLMYGLSMAAAVAVVIGSSAVYTTAFAKSYVAIDINPSIELETNGFGKVTDVYGVNEDAKNLIEELDIEGKQIDSAVEEIIEEAIEEGYVSQDKENAILVSVDGKKPAKAEDIKKTITESIDNVLEEQVIEATVKTQNVNINKAIIEEAHNKGVSVGRLTVIERIMQEDNTVTLKDISKISVQDLLEYASVKNISLDDLLDSVEDAYEDITGEDKHDDDADADEIDDDDDDNKKEQENNKNKEKIKENNKYKTKNDNGNKNDDDEDADEIDDDDEDKKEQNNNKYKDQVKENNKYKTKNDNGDKAKDDDDDDKEDAEDIDDDKDDIEEVDDDKDDNKGEGKDDIDKDKDEDKDDIEEVEDDKDDIEEDDDDEKGNKSDDSKSDNSKSNNGSSNKGNK